jgi:RNase P protein component
MFRAEGDAGRMDLVVIPKTTMMEASRVALEQDFQSTLRRFRVQSKP